MARKTKEEEQFELERKRRLREKQMLQLRASNEMLEEVKKGIINRYGEDSDTGYDLLQDIQTAQDQNSERAQTYLNVNLEEADYLEYNEVKPQEEEAYYKRLKNLGKSDELIRMKNVEEQLKMYEEQKKRTTAMPTKKPKSKLAELNEKLKQLKSVESSVTNEEKVQEAKETITKMSEEHTDTPKVVERVKEPDVKVNEIREDEVYPDFDPRDVPSYIQYDMIPLPSKGECYAHKKAKIPVAYLTAADENLITSRNLYNSGSMIDIILERKILDKSIRVSDLCKGDRDAIAIWLRATAYGPDYPVVAPYNGEEIETNIDLSNIEYLDFELKGDENGWFDYKTERGDLLKFKVLTYKDEVNLLTHNNQLADIVNRSEIIKCMNKSITYVMECNSENKDDIIETIKLIKDWASNDDNVSTDDNSKHMTYLTDRMVIQTMAVNGNTDREYIKLYIENMLAKDALEYRTYLSTKVPGVNLNIEIPVPESLGGGSFTTFLPIGETIFINV